MSETRAARALRAVAANTEFKFGEDVSVYCPTLYLTTFVGMAKRIATCGWDDLRVG